MCCWWCCFSVGLTYVLMTCLVIFFLFDYVFFPLWPAGGVLHFHPDNVCSEDRDKVSMKHDHCLLPLLCSWFEKDLYAIVFVFILSFCLSSFCFFPWPTIPLFPPPPLPLCADGRQPEPEKAASFSAVHVGFKLRPSLYSFLSHSSLGASSQSQTSPPLHAREMPHASSQSTKVSVWHTYNHYLHY